MNLHNEVRRFYKKLARSKNPKSRFPKNKDDLITQLRLRQENRMTNHLVRIGRICNYTSKAGPKLSLEEVENSDFWLSLGQAQIKETEAFVRVWRAAVTHGMRSLKAWVDPQGAIFNPRKVMDVNQRKLMDVTDHDITTELNIETFLIDANAKKNAVGSQSMYFGPDGPLNGLAEDDQKHVFNACIRYLASCRHSSFHFNSRVEMIDTLSLELSDTVRKRGGTQYSGSLPASAKDAIRNFYVRDVNGLNQRLLTDLQGAQVDRFSDIDDFSSLFAAIQTSAHADDGDVILPGFKRLLHRIENITQYVDGLRQGKDKFTIAQLPPEPNLNGLEDAAENARYVGLKTLYDGPFRQHIGAMTAGDIAPYLDRANQNMTALAKSTNSTAPYSDSIMGRAEHLPKIEVGETIVQYSSRLTQITAQEFEVQKGYNSKPEEAKKQAGFIEDFKRDFVGLIFDSYLNDTGFDWLKEIQPGQNQINRNPKQPSLAEPSVDVESWQPGLYLALHFMPFDDVSRLLHQFKRWGALQNKLALEHIDTQSAERQVDQFKKVLSLFLKMHDGKIDGAGNELDVSSLRDFFERDEDFNAIYNVATTTSADQSETVSATRKGLRQILKYNHLPKLKDVFEKHKVQKSDISRLEVLERRDAGGTSLIKKAHKDRAQIHQNTINTKGISDSNLTEFRTALSTIAEHKALVGKVYFGDFVRIHRLMMLVISRLVDFAGLWERDCHEKTGFVKQATTYLKDQKGLDIEWNHPQFPTAKQTRNNLVHFNVLAQDRGQVNLTDLTNQTRTMMMYDRKLKNTVTKAIIEIMAQEGIKLEWEMSGHNLVNATISAVDIAHFKKIKAIKPKPKEKRHNPAFLEMLASLFDGKVEGESQSTGANEPSKPIHGNANSPLGKNRTGTVKFFNSQKGWGFITPDAGDDDDFVHISDVRQAGLGEIKEDQRVSYELKKNPNGRLSATKLKLISE